MESKEFEIQDAQRYLAENNQLRVTLEIPDDAVVIPHPLGLGEHNKNYWFTHPAKEKKLVLRVNVAPQPFHDNQIAYEYAALRALASSGRTPTPFYIDDSEGSPAYGALVTSFCEGEELDFDSLNPDDLGCVAHIMADVHAVETGEQTKFYRPEDPLRSLYEECLERIDVYKSSGYEEERLTKWVTLFAQTCEQTLSTKRYPEDCTHIINTEPLPSHFLIPRSSGRTLADAQGGPQLLAGHPGYFIDWERPIIGEVAQDVAYFVSPTTTFWDSEYLFPKSNVDAFIEEYWKAVDGRFARGNFDERFKAFRMMTVLRSVSWCCRALSVYRGGNGHTTEKTARKLPIYLSDEFMEMLADTCFGL